MTQEPRLTHPTLKVLNAVLSARDREVSGADVAESTSLASGTLYPILLRLEKAGWLTSRWEKINPHLEGRPRRRLYRVTVIGAAKARAAIVEIFPEGKISWA
jgi:DNA-binding PadR family transcriptional regulator